MSWFQKFCRNAGLMVHGIKQPIEQDKAQRGTKEIVKHEVQEEQLDENVTLRRTTIEEIETRRIAKPEPGSESVQGKTSSATSSDVTTEQNSDDAQP